MQRQQKMTQKGFTLVELVVVIAVLGILAATALPRFINVNASANRAAAQGLLGAMNSAASLVRAQYIASAAAASPIVVDGQNVAVTTTGTTPGYPTAAAAGIGAAVTDIAGFAAGAPAAGVIAYTKAGTTCVVTYTEATGLATLGTAAAPASGNCA